MAVGIQRCQQRELQPVLNQVRVEQVGSHVLVQINAYGDLNPDVEIMLSNTSLANVTSSDFPLVSGQGNRGSGHRRQR